MCAITTIRPILGDAPQRTEAFALLPQMSICAFSLNFFRDMMI